MFCLALADETIDKLQPRTERAEICGLAHRMRWGLPPDPRPLVFRNECYSSDVSSLSQRFNTTYGVSVVDRPVCETNNNVQLKSLMISKQNMSRSIMQDNPSFLRSARQETVLAAHEEHRIVSRPAQMSPVDQSAADAEM